MLKVEHPVGGVRYGGVSIPIQRGDPLTRMSKARSKQSVTIDLHRTDGVEIFKQLVEKTDAVCENSRPRTLERRDWDGRCGRCCARFILS